MDKLSIFISLSDGVSNRFFPLGARYIIKIIEDYNHKVLFLQDRVLKQENILETIKNNNPSLVWISIQPSVENLFEFLQQISKIYTGTIILGNIGSRWITKEQLITLNLNILIISGQGEDATKELMTLVNEDLLNIKSLKNIFNIYGYMNKKYFENKTIKIVNNQKIIPSTNGLKEAIKRGDIITLRTSSGCNFHCTFCSVKDINNGQSWKRFEDNILDTTLQDIVDNGMKEGIVRFIDDDTAVSLEYLLEISQIFKKINYRNSTKIQFGFATNAIHIYNPSDTKDEAVFRKEVWKEVVNNGLTDLFLGLESGSTTQLKRLGKNTNAEINYRAFDFAQELNIDLEIGFIPIDPLMKDELWKQEFLDNIKLAKYVNSYISSPTWLATVRVYENSPLKKSLVHHNLLGEKIQYSNEYQFNYRSNEVKLFIKNLGILLCDDDTNNGLYRLKRELKNVLRYSEQHSTRFVSLISNVSYEISTIEFNYIESIIHNTSFDLYKKIIIKKLLLLLNTLESSLYLFTQEAYCNKILASVEVAIISTEKWKEER